MNKQQHDNVIKLCEILESGTYKKGVNMLKNYIDNSFCCLGVACDISGLGVWREEEEVGYMAYVIDGDDQCSPCCSLPDDVADYYGFNHSDGFYDSNKYSLVDYNDGKLDILAPKSHPEIAGIIREWLATQVIDD